MDLPSLMEEERRRLSAKIKKHREAIAGLPDGSLTMNKNGDYFKCYVFKNGTRSYLSKKDQKTIEGLAKKRYLQTELTDFQTEIFAIDQYLDHHQKESAVDQLLKSERGIADILKPLITLETEKYQQWAEEDYPKYQGFPQDLIHQGPFGKMYRSKTEAAIAFLLVKNQIPNRYEWEHLINGTAYPIDFTTRHPKTGKYIYWEHFGKMDDPSYCMKIGPKLRDFESVGIFPDINLIMTFESKQYPMNISQLEEIVHQWYT